MKIRSSLAVSTLAFTLLISTSLVRGQTQSLTVLHSFGGADGAQPVAPLMQANDGNLYGTTEAGGSANTGTVFEVTPSGTFTGLISFSGLNPGNYGGAYPYAPLVQGTDGNFYGTANSGGGYNYGTVFEVTSAGLISLWDFTGMSDGANPMGGLIQATNGTFYGTTSVRGGTGTQDCLGSVFNLSIHKPESSTDLSTIFSFYYGTGMAPYPNGSSPRASLIEDSSGNLYGTTLTGDGGDGVSFEITPSGNFTELGVADGSYGSLVFGNDGYLYGACFYGGTSSLGCVFKVSPAGQPVNETVIYSFSGSDGDYPYDGLIKGTDGNFYGTTSKGGANNTGTVFKITPAGALTTLYNFSGVSGGDVNNRLYRM